ncbi:cupin domain-containing protein [Roseovarius sp.]|uniref:cupin domain-containing protein n=1 Tax=Roseovarius sp. TaxID=1486281 RepID=UPI000C6819CA|nr:cupin domain-containing protein [Roseovarius sp.]MAO28363.1 hypothetical protein [Roseovarius sp.]MAZ22012.1 hypothetical protein [Roseovarius sp.]|tara:strand:- start:304 stop:834 length:531 start_codon:yes stop_codon:yes gene_type:complete
MIARMSSKVWTLGKWRKLVLHWIYRFGRPGALQDVGPVGPLACCVTSNVKEEFMSDLKNAPTDASKEQSVTLNMIQIKDIMLQEGGKPILERMMRLRRLDVFPGGVVPVHSHENRPAILFVLHGSMTIHSNKDDKPLVINQGESVTEFNDIRHYAKNNSDSDFLQILTFDLFDDGK